MSILAVNQVPISYMTCYFKDIGLIEYGMRKSKGIFHVN